MYYTTCDVTMCTGWEQKSVRGYHRRVRFDGHVKDFP